MTRALDIKDYFKQIFGSLEPIFGSEPDIIYKVRLDWDQFVMSQEYRPPVCFISYQGWQTTDYYSGGLAEQIVDKYDVYINIDTSEDDDTGAIFRQIRTTILLDPELLIGDQNSLIYVGDGEAMNMDNNTILLRLPIEVVNA